MSKKFKRFLEKFFLIDDTPHKIAAGAALGIFLGIFPGEGVLSTLFFAAIFRLNKLAATAGVLATNMWTTFLLLPPSVAIGSFLFRKNYTDLINQFYQIHHTDTLKETIFVGLYIFSKAALPILIGFLIVAGTVSVGFYFLLYYILKKRHINNLRDSIHVKIT